MKKLLLLSLISLLSVSCKNDDYIPVSKILLFSSHLEMVEGDVKTIEHIVLPEDATNREVRWHSTDEKVACVNHLGEIRALSEGTTNIIASVDNGTKADTCFLSVSIYDVEGPKIESFSYTPKSVDVTNEMQYVTFTAHITDKVGVADGFHLCVGFYDEGHDHPSHSIYKGMRLISGDKKNGVYETKMMFNNKQRPGVWSISFLNFKDELGNETITGRIGDINIINNKP